MFILFADKTMQMNCDWTELPILIPKYPDFCQNPIKIKELLHQEVIYIFHIIFTNKI